MATIETFAILDDGSSDTLIRRDIADKLNFEGPERLLCLGNIENNGTLQCSRAVNLLVTPTTWCCHDCGHRSNVLSGTSY